MDEKNRRNILLALVLVVMGVGLLFGGKLLMDAKSTKDNKGVVANVYEITADGRKLVKSLSLEQDKKELYEFKGKLGTTVVEIDGLRARVKSSPCPDQVCVRFGWLTCIGDFSACLPNAMMVIIEDGSTIGF